MQIWQPCSEDTQEYRQNNARQLQEKIRKCKAPSRREEHDPIITMPATSSPTSEVAASIKRVGCLTQEFPEGYYAPAVCTFPSERANDPFCAV